MWRWTMLPPAKFPDVLGLINGSMARLESELRSLARPRWRAGALGPTATPDVSGGANVYAAAHPLAVTGFAGGQAGQCLVLVCTTGDTTFVHNGTTLSLAGAADRTPPANSVLVLVTLDGSHFREAPNP